MMFDEAFPLQRRMMGSRRRDRGWTDRGPRRGRGGIDRLSNEDMKKAGVQIDTASPALVGEMQAKTQPMIDAWIKDVRDKRNMDGAMLLKDFRQELKYATENRE